MSWLILYTLFLTSFFSASGELLLSNDMAVFDASSFVEHMFPIVLKEVWNDALTNIIYLQNYEMKVYLLRFLIYLKGNYARARA